MSESTIQRAMEFAKEAWSNPPARNHIVRPEPRGDLVVTFVLPLELLKSQNRQRRKKDWQYAKERKALATTLMVLSGFRDYRHREPLPGRPQVLCTRFSATEPDRYADWAKAAVDALCVPKARRKWGLGYLVDDNPRSIDLHQWWEPAPRGQGFGIMRVFSDEEQEEK